ncbi:MAG: hypothetical protein H0U92_05180 [Actinobacteria bacterium]|nr:hypothetical protein [Actinomycetota bacterium]
MVDLDRRLAEIARHQHCLITLEDVIKSGGTADHARRRVQSGRWVWVFHGVYRLAGVPWTYEAQVLALVFAAGPGAVASFMCAARLLGFGFPTAAPEVTIPRGRKPLQGSARVHTSTDLDRCSIVVRNGIPMTDPARTILDLGRYLKERALARAAEAARRQELVTWHDLIECLTAHARKGRHGVRRLRMVISGGVRNSAVTDTDSELLALSIFREHGFDEPTLQHRVYDDEGELVAEMDFAYVDRMINFEINGSVHLDPEVAEKDEARDQDLRSRGWTVRRIWWEIPVHQPDKFVRILRATLRAAEARRPFL